MGIKRDMLSFTIDPVDGQFLGGFSESIVNQLHYGMDRNMGVDMDLKVARVCFNMSKCYKTKLQWDVPMNDRMDIDEAISRYPSIQANGSKLEGGWEEECLVPLNDMNWNAYFIYL